MLFHVSDDSLLRNKDFLGGVLLMAVGATAGFIAQDYTFGTPLRMGPGFLPVCLAALLFLIGLSLAARSGATGGRINVAGTLRPLIVVLAAVAAFSLMIERAGLVLASLVLVLICCTAQPKYPRNQALLLAVSLTVGVVCLFVLALGIPFQIWPF